MKKYVRTKEIFVHSKAKTTLIMKCMKIHLIRLLKSDFFAAQEIADPFFAYCRQHGDKLVVRAKRRNYLAIQSHYRSHQERDRDMDEKEQVSCK